MLERWSLERLDDNVGRKFTRADVCVSKSPLEKYQISHSMR